ILNMIRPAGDARFGDYQANCAMPLGNRLKRPPREIAAELVEQVELDGGLAVTADPEGVSRGTYSPSEEPFIASVWVDPQESGVPLEGIDGTVVGVWYLGNYDLQLDPSWPLGGTLDLDEGTELQVWTASNSDKAWIDEGVLTVGADGSLAQTGGEGISQLTTLLLVLEKETP
ncbi:MAG: hypothetical protein QGG40_11500, partial [Myxococcota bacterium]|nr:hypothetical protein [Myxococcota bacterium]